MRAKLKAILDDAPNSWAALFALRLLLSPVKVRQDRLQYPDSPPPPRIYADV